MGIYLYPKFISLSVNWWHSKHCGRGTLSARLSQGGLDSAVKELFTRNLQSIFRVSHPPYTFTMRSLSPALASLANVFRIPMSLTPARPSVARACTETLTRRPTQPGPITAAVQSAPFSSTSAMAKRKGQGPNVDKRISMCPSSSGPEWSQLVKTNASS